MTELMNIPKIPIDEYTSPCTETAEAETPIHEVYEHMRSLGIRHIPVVRDGHAIGIISERDIKTIINIEGSEELRAKNIMTPAPYTVLSGTDLSRVALEMSRHKYGSALVENEGGEIVGIFTSTDALNALVEILRGEIHEGDD